MNTGDRHYPTFKEMWWGTYPMQCKCQITHLVVDDRDKWSDGKCSKTVTEQQKLLWDV